MYIISSIGPRRGRRQERDRGEAENKETTNRGLQNDAGVDKHREIGQENVEGSLYELHQRFAFVGMKRTPVWDGMPLYPI